MILTRRNILNRIRTKKPARVKYNESYEFIIPLTWRHNPDKTRSVSVVSEDHAKMLLASSGAKLAHGGVTIPNHNDYLGTGKNFVTLMHRGGGNYFVQVDQYHPSKPTPLPDSFDLSKRLRPHEDLDSRPNEMMPEDFYM